MMLAEIAVGTAPVALALLILGSLAKVRRLLGPRKFNDLPEREMGIKGKLVTKGLWDTVVTPFTRYHLPANPVRSAAWAGFHLGVLLMLYHGIGALYTVLANNGLEARNVLGLVRIAEHDKPSMLDLLESLGGIMILAGGLLLLSFRVSGATGGMRRPIDRPTKALPTATQGLTSIMDILVMLMVLSLAATGVLVHYYDASLVGAHALLAVLLMAVLPFTKLSHFLFGYWAGIIYGARRRIQGITA